MTVNEMIIEAITTDSRKRKARHQTELENIGYKVVKDGGWYIRNPKTNRFIEKAYSDDGIRSSRGYIRFGYVWSRSKHKYVKKPISVINFAGLLDEPEKQNNFFDDENSTARLKSALDNRKYHKKNLDNAMAEYQTKIDNITKEYKRMLKNAEDSYKWNLEYHTKELKRANKNIENILNKSIDN